MAQKVSAQGCDLWPACRLPPQQLVVHRLAHRHERLVDCHQVTPPVCIDMPDEEEIIHQPQHPARPDRLVGVAFVERNQIAGQMGPTELALAVRELVIRGEAV